MVVCFFTCESILQSINFLNSFVHDSGCENALIHGTDF